ncbi:hypothetical protein F2Q69_00035841 [Brassica cretica]|uniref:Uncharacterized protein n=1 Tax=Brassica cretica TaxID=69181 RepID=A0A8S9SH35_BRACR|nr:hypothetical protein F2Q69_00035841 [Brassica cretica]
MKTRRECMTLTRCSRARHMASRTETTQRDDIKGELWIPSGDSVGWEGLDRSPLFVSSFSLRDISFREKQFLGNFPVSELAGERVNWLAVQLAIWRAV